MLTKLIVAGISQYLCVPHHATAHLKLTLYVNSISKKLERRRADFWKNYNKNCSSQIFKGNILKGIIFKFNKTKKLY